MLLLQVDDSQSPSGIMSSWCMCEWGVSVEWVVDESEVSEAGSLRCDAWLFDVECMRPASRFIARRECPSCLSSEGAFEVKSSIIPSYYCLDSWTELRALIIVLATVE